MKTKSTKVVLAGDRGPLLYMEPELEQREGEPDENFDKRIEEASIGIEGLYISGGVEFAGKPVLEISITWDPNEPEAEPGYPPKLDESEENESEDEKLEIIDKIGDVLERFTKDELVTIMKEEMRTRGYYSRKLLHDLEWYGKRLDEDIQRREDGDE